MAKRNARVGKIFKKRAPGWLKNANDWFEPPPDSEAAKRLIRARKVTGVIGKNKLGKKYVQIPCEVGIAIGMGVAHLELAKKAQVERDRRAWARFKRTPYTPDAPPKHKAPAGGHGGLVGPVTPIAPPPRRKPAAASDWSQFPKQDNSWSRNNGWSDNNWSTPKKRK